MNFTLNLVWLISLNYYKLHHIYSILIKKRGGRRGS